MRAQILNHYNIIALFTDAVSNTRVIVIRSIRIILILLLGIPSFAQLKFKIYSEESGLSNNNVTCITQDHSGYLWVGTKNGLNRFDGNTFKNFNYSAQDKNTLFSNFIRCLAVDKFNRIWIGHESSITRYDPARNSFIRYSINSPDPITFISFDNLNKVWVGVWGNGVLVLNPETGAIEKRIELTPFINKNYSQGKRKQYNTIEAMVEDSSGKVWLATYDGLYVYDKKPDAVNPVRVVDDTEGRHRNDYFKRILEDKKGDFWLAAYNGGVCYYSRSKNLFSVNQTTVKQYDSNLDVSFTNTVNDIAWKSESELWFTTWDKDKSLGIFNIQTKTFSFLKFSEIFENEIKTDDLLFTDLFVDRKGIVWVGSEMGLVMINHKDALNVNSIFKVYPPRNSNIGAIVEDTILQKKFLTTLDDSKLVVSNLKDNTVHAFPGRRNPAYDDMMYTADLLNTSGDSMWIISRDNIRLFDKVKEKWIDLPQLQKLEAHTSPVSPLFYKMIRASSGDYWIATVRNGAFTLRSSDLSFKNYRRDVNSGNSICSNSLSDVLEDKFGRIWFATRNAGISILDPVNSTFKTLSREKENSSFLPTNAISDLDIDHDGNVWVASVAAGIVKIEVVSKDSLNLITFDHELLTGDAYEVKIDGEGRVWFTASRKVNILDPKTMNIKSIDEMDGFLNSYYSLLESNDRVFINGSIGYGTIDDTSLLPDTASSPLVINSVKVFGKELYPGGVNNDRIELPYDQNSIAIDFAGIDFVNSEKITYSYKLEGLSKSEWTSPSSNRSTEFAHLSGGDYIFKLRMYNQDGIAGKEQSLLFIHIETPFWEKKSFHALLIVIGIGLIGLVYFYQINQIKDRENTNRRISQLQLKALHTQMRPHFIFNCLSAINSHIIKFETVKASEFLSQFSRLMRGILENSTESWITLEQEIETLKLYLVMEGLRFEDKFSYKIEVEEDVQPNTLLIPSMIIQPYVENAIGHGILHKEYGTGIVSIKFLIGDGNLKCIIEDNGIGRERSGQIKQRSKVSRKSLGLQITAERLQLLQGSSAADIQDLKNEFGEPAGTRITVMLMTKKIRDKELVNLN